ncbi:MAG: alpha/beta hydrolase fold domain-containing protein [Anaerolineales bacterium]|nr:alpha/beta hydrolase fold domain-containing protein [Anaerolineales bacterium]
MFLKSDAGRIRVLAYDMRKSEVHPLFFDIHGGGFVPGQAEMDALYRRNAAKQANEKILSIGDSPPPEAEFPGVLNECSAIVK